MSLSVCQAPLFAKPVNNYPPFVVEPTAANILAQKAVMLLMNKRIALRKPKLAEPDEAIPVHNNKFLESVLFLSEVFLAQAMLCYQATKLRTNFIRMCADLTAASFFKRMSISEVKKLFGKMII